MPRVDVRVFSYPECFPVAGVLVRLMDRDQRSGDDLLGEARTDTQGIASVTYDPKSAADTAIGPHEETRAIGFAFGLPDLYVALMSPEGQVVTTTRGLARENQAIAKIDVPVDQSAIARLLPQRKESTIKQKEAAWHSAWTARVRKDRKHIVDICTAGVILDTIAATPAPKTAEQKRLARRMKTALTAERFEAVTKRAAEARELVDAVGVAACKNITVKELAKMYISPAGPLYNLSQALTPDPDPFNSTATPQAGLPFTRTAEGRKDCGQIRVNGELVDKDQPSEVVPPMVHLIRAYDRTTQKFARELALGERVLTLHHVDDMSPNGMLHREIGLDVPLDHASCLIKHRDPSTGRQINVVDVTASQTIEIRGSGFIAAKGRLFIEHASWRAPEDGRLVASSIFSTPSQLTAPMEVIVEGAAVHGPNDRAETFANDKIAFVWPRELAAPGLYRVEIEFDNDTGTPTSVTRDGACALVRDHTPVRSFPLWFAVLPTPQAKDIRPLIAQLTCEDMVDPEGLGPVPFADTMVVDANMLITRPKLLADATHVEPELEFVADNSVGTSEHHFWADGQTWAPNIAINPQGGAPRTLALDESMVLALNATEVFGALDRFLIRAIVWAIVITAAIIATAILLILAIALFVGVLALLSWWNLLPAAGTIGYVAVVGAIGGVIFTTTFAAIVTFVWGPAIKGALAASDAIIAQLDGARRIVAATSTLTGAELAFRLSDLRWHHLLWPHARETSVQGVGLGISSELTAQLFRETYTASASGGRYALQLDVAM